MRFAREFLAALAVALPLSSPAGDDGIVRVRSTFTMQETLERIKQDIASKGIKHFGEIDQAALAAAAAVKLRLITQDSDAQVWAVYSDFHWIAARHGIRDRDTEFATATKVISSITASVAPK